MDHQRVTMRHHDFVTSPSTTPSSAFPTREATPTANIASFEASHIRPAPLSGLKDPASDTIFFTDPRVKFDINAFWDNPAGSDRLTIFGNQAHHPCKTDASYNNADDFIPPYDPVADDAKVFQEHSEHVVEDRAEGERREGEREMRLKELRVKKLQQMRDELERLRNDEKAGGVKPATQQYGVQ